MNINNRWLILLYAYWDEQDNPSPDLVKTDVLVLM